MQFAEAEALRRQYDRGEPLRLYLPPPEEFEVTTHEIETGKVIVQDVLYEKCGGGRRVIRKRIGRN